MVEKNFKVTIMKPMPEAQFCGLIKLIYSCLVRYTWGKHKNNFILFLNS